MRRITNTRLRCLSNQAPISISPEPGTPARTQTRHTSFNDTETTQHIRDLIACWKKLSNSCENGGPILLDGAMCIQDELRLAASTSAKLLDECECLHDLWSDAALRLEESKKEAGDLREELFRAKESLDLARTRDAEIVHLRQELHKRLDELDDLRSALNTANADRKAIQARNSELRDELEAVKGVRDEALQRLSECYEC